MDAQPDANAFRYNSANRQTADTALSAHSIASRYNHIMASVSNDNGLHWVNTRRLEGVHTKAHLGADQSIWRAQTNSAANIASSPPAL